MNTIRQIETFLESGPIAMAGVSRNPKKFGHMAFKELREKGLDLIPVNPSGEDILGVKSYCDVRSLPAEIGGLLIMTKKEKSASVVREAREKGIRNIWIQQSSDTPEALAELKDSGTNLITGECIMMFFKPHSFHKFHRGLNKLFGRYPR